MQDLRSPLVSVITPFFNGEQYMRETIESVIRQNYTNWELILIDDGSTDASVDIAMSYSENFPQKILFFQHENRVNKGPSASRNLGIKKAKGELVAFLDSDDLWLPEKLSRQIGLLQNNSEADVICEATMYWSSWTDSQKSDLEIKVGVEENKIYPPASLASQLYPLGPGPGFCNCALIVKKELIDKFGGFDESFVGKNQLYEDQVMFVKLYLHGTVYISSSCNNFYRQRPDSLMHGLYAEGYSLQGKYFFLKWLAKYLKENRINDRKIHRALIKALMPYHYPLLSKITRKVEALLTMLKANKQSK